MKHGKRFSTFPPCYFYVIQPFFCSTEHKKTEFMILYFSSHHPRIADVFLRMVYGPQQQFYRNYPNHKFKLNLISRLLWKKSKFEKKIMSRHKPMFMAESNIQKKNLLLNVFHYFTTLRIIQFCNSLKVLHSSYSCKQKLQNYKPKLK